MTRRNSYQPSTYLSFNGAANSYVSLAATNVLTNATAACSMAAWVYLSPLGTGSTDAIRMLIGNRRDSTTAGWSFKVSNRAKDCIEFSFYDQNSSSQGWISNVAVPYYRWANIGFSFDGTQVIFYIDGNPDPKETVGVAKTVKEYTGQNLRIGHRQAAGSTAETFAGKMGGLLVANKKMSATEFSDYYNFRTVPSTGLRAHWRMDEGTGTTITDNIGGFTGTLTGGVTWETTQLVPSRTASPARTAAGARSLASGRNSV